MEERIQSAISGNRNASLRLDIRYRRVAGAHVILELKRGSRRLAKTEIEQQLAGYIQAVEAELKKDPEQHRWPIEGICVVGKLPRGWEDHEQSRRDKESLRAVRIRVITYDELINNAESAYAKFEKATTKTEKLNVILDRIRNYRHEGVTG